MRALILAFVCHSALAAQPAARFDGVKYQLEKPESTQVQACPRSFTAAMQNIGGLTHVNFANFNFVWSEQTPREEEVAGCTFPRVGVELSDTRLKEDLTIECKTGKPRGRAIRRELVITPGQLKLRIWPLTKTKDVWQPSKAPTLDCSYRATK